MKKLVPYGSISVSVMRGESGEMMRNAIRRRSGHGSSKRRAKPRNERILTDLRNKSVGGPKGVCSFGRRAKPEKGRQRAFKASVGRGKAQVFPLQSADGRKSAC